MKGNPFFPRASDKQAADNHMLAARPQPHALPHPVSNTKVSAQNRKAREFRIGIGMSGKSRRSELTLNLRSLSLSLSRQAGVVFQEK